jgi:hypothetical protein
LIDALTLSSDIGVLKALITMYEMYIYGDNMYKQEDCGYVLLFTRIRTFSKALDAGENNFRALECMR